MRNALTFDWFDVLLIIGLIQGLLAAGLLLFSKRDRFSNRLLGWCFFFISLSLLKMLRITLGLQEVESLLYLPLSMELLPAPLFYLYTLSVVKAGKQPNRSNWWYLLPGILFMLHALLIYVLCLMMPDLGDKTFLAEERLLFSLVNQVEDVLAALFAVIFAILSLRLLVQYHCTLLEYAADRFAYQIRWFVVMLSFLMVVVLFTVLTTIANIIFNYSQHQFWLEEVYIGAVACFLYFAAIYAIRQVQLPSLQAIKLIDETDSEMDRVRLESVFSNVETAMKEHQIFRDPELSLPILAQRLDLKPVELSKSIKAIKGLSFRDYLNSHRVNLIKEKMQSSDMAHLTLFGMALECGFNSEASFYRIFKKLEGQSPKSYRAREASDDSTA